MLLFGSELTDEYVFRKSIFNFNINYETTLYKYALSSVFS